MSARLWVLGRRVFVFTPTGGVMNLPHGSTVVDYAFYTDTGLDMVQAKAGGLLRISTRPTLNRRAEPARMYELSP